MQNKRDIFKQLTSVFALMCVSATFVMLSCKDGKQAENQAWVDSVLHEIDSVAEDTLAYEIPDEEPGEHVDENFNDFLYAFIRNHKFQSERISFPLKVVSLDGEKDEKLEDVDDFRKIIKQSNRDYYVLLLKDLSELEADPASQALRANVHFVDLDASNVQSFSCSREDGTWRVNGLTKMGFSASRGSSFLEFYQQFATDSVYRASHLAQTIDVTRPDDDNMLEMIEGTIDAEQFVSYSPELPKGRFMVVEYNMLKNDASDEYTSVGADIDFGGSKCVMVKCGMANSMMDVLNFEKCDDAWMLTGMEE